MGDKDTPTRRVGDVQIGIAIGQLHSLEKKVDSLTENLVHYSDKMDTLINSVHIKCNGRHKDVETALTALRENKVNKADLNRTITMVVLIIGVIFTVVEVISNLFQ